MSGNSRQFVTKPFDRKHYYQLLAIGKNDLGWDEEFYRGIWLPGQGATKDQQGRYTPTTLTNAQLRAALQTMKDLGFKVKPKTDLAGAKPSARKLADDGQSQKIRALWLQLHEAKKVKDPGERALVNWAKGQFKTTQGVEALQWFDVQQKIILIEQLKRWLAR